MLPYGLGVRLGAVWEAQTTHVTLAGNLAAQEARALLVQARVGEFASVPLVFAWTRAENVPLLLGQVISSRNSTFASTAPSGNSNLSLRADDRVARVLGAASWRLPFFGINNPGLGCLGC